MESNMNNLKLAQQYLNFGWSVIPVINGGKKPLIDWKEYQQRKPTEVEITNWWTKWPNANIGVITGKISNVIVIDIDPQHGATSESFSTVTTVTAQTGSGGRHYFFKYVEGIGSRTAIKQGIDVRADGGYVVVSPSIHASGKCYEWIFGPGKNAIASLPSFVFYWLQDKVGNKDISNWQTNKLTGVCEGERNNTATSIAGKLLTRFPQQEWETIAWPLLQAWNQQNKPPLEDSELKEVYLSIANRESKSQEHNNNILNESDRTNENVNVNDNGYGSCKQEVKFELTESKLKAISELKQCNYRTAPKDIAQLLEELFKEWPSQSGWWLSVAQHWTPKSINSVIYQMIKLHKSGSTTFHNFASYFTSIIIHMPKRKVFRRISDTRKQQVNKHVDIISEAEKIFGTKAE